MKNLIITFLLLVILNILPGWQVQGVNRVLVNISLFILVDYTIVELDRIIKYGRR
jgi:hypothetical protein|nr:MAG TPA: hypothetical protein [Caudoviricetes sp.]